MPDLHVLIVDDEDNYREALAERLSLRGLTVSTAPSGEKCLELVPDRHPDVVVLDVRMAGMDGLETLSRIKERCPGVEVIMLTGYASPQDGVQGMKLGAFDYLVKPIDIEHLQRKITQAHDTQLRRQERRREAEFRVRMEHRMAEAQRLASLGTLAAGVAHEINNPLAIINEAAGWLSMLAEQLASGDNPPSPDQFAKPVAIIEKSVERARTITHQLLDYARGKDSTVREVDLKEEVEEVGDLMRKQAQQARATIVVEADPALPRVATDPDQLRQVLINLIGNALDAMQPDGTITISLGPNDSGASIAVADTGSGIPPDVLEHIFEPFYSTKPQGKGTGLGLFVSKGIMEKLGGGLSVSSTPGQGTTFTISLPLEHEPVS